MRLNLEARSYYKVKASGFSKKLMQQFLINCLNFLFPHRLLGNRLILLPDKAARGLNQTNCCRNLRPNRCCLAVLQEWLHDLLNRLEKASTNDWWLTCYTFGYPAIPVF